MVRTTTFFFLLFGEDTQYIVYSLLPNISEYSGIACLLPISVGKTNRIAKRINLIFALMVIEIHVRLVTLPLSSGRTIIESVGIGVNVDEFELTENRTAQHLLQRRILICQLHIREHLSTGIAQPHGVDVTCINKGIVFTIFLVYAIVHRSVDCVWITVLKHPAEIGVFLQQFLYPCNLLLHCLGMEKAILHFRTLRHISQFGGVSRGYCLNWQIGNGGIG